MITPNGNHMSIIQYLEYLVREEVLEKFERINEKEFVVTFYNPQLGDKE